MTNNVKIIGSGELGNADYSQIMVHGTVKLKSDIEFEQLEVFGYIESNNILEGNEVNIIGSMNGNSIIKSTKFVCEFSSDSKCSSIISDNVKIIPQKTIFRKKKCFVCETISGSEIILSDISAKSITGKSVYIEGESRVQELRYANEYKISESCVVDKIIKIE